MRLKSVFTRLIPLLLLVIFVLGIAACPTTKDAMKDDEMMKKEEMMDDK